MKIVLIEDHPVLREALAELLTEQCGGEVVGQTGTARDGVALVEAQAPDVVVLDLMLPGSSGIAAVHEIRRAAPKAKVLVYTAVSGIQFAVDAFAAGCHGYALKSQEAAEVVFAVSEVAAGKLYTAPSIAQALRNREKQGVTASGLESLSKREREVFDLVVAGHANTAIAGALFISVKTVETHRGRINSKLGVHTTAQLLHFAAARDLLGGCVVSEI